jgi:hypothetical protein
MALHLQTHKQKHNATASLFRTKKPQKSPKTDKITLESFPCSCGSRFNSRTDFWNHLKKHLKTSKEKPTDIRHTCQICNEPERIFLSTSEIDRICPTCALSHFKSKIILGIPLINHLGIEYEDAFRAKAGSLLAFCNLNTLTDLGVTVTLITFSADGSTTFCVSPKGEVVFIVRDVPELKEQNLESFETVVTHELFHLYINNKLGLGVSPKLHHAYSFVSGEAVNVADDIELIKIAVKEKVTPLLLDEVKRTNSYYKI